MPNWCNNHVTVEHDNPAKILGLLRAFRQGRMFQYIFPMPPDLLRDGAASFGGANADEYDRIRQENQERHGYPSWYEFALDRWGTKWDVGNVNDVGSWSRERLDLSFESAWSPPIAVYSAMEEQGYRVSAWYHEPGMSFVGKYSDGQDEYYEYSDSDPDAVRGHIGEDLDDFFGISEMIREFQEENEEELTAWIRNGVKQQTTAAQPAIEHA